MRTSTDKALRQTGRTNCRSSHGRHVLGFHKRAEEESPAELHIAIEQHSSRAGIEVHTKAPAKLQPSFE